MTVGAARGSADTLSGPTDDGGAHPEPLSGHSRFVQRLRRRYAAELPLLPPGAPGSVEIAQAYEALRARGHDVSAALRMLRQVVAWTARQFASYLKSPPIMLVKNQCLPSLAMP